MILPRLRNQSLELYVEKHRLAGADFAKIVRAMNVLLHNVISDIRLLGSWDGNRPFISPHTKSARHPWRSSLCKSVSY